MKTQLIEKEAFQVKGLNITTSTAREMDPETAKIGATWMEFSQKFLNPEVQAPVRFGIYSNYEDAHKGNYQVTIGTDSKDMPGVKDGLVTKDFPAGKYLVFTTEVGAMPDTCIQAWQYIWNYFDGEAEFERTYVADFEVYDERAMDPSKCALDIYISVK